MLNIHSPRYCTGQTGHCVTTHSLRVQLYSAIPCTIAMPSPGRKVDCSAMYVVGQIFLRVQHSAVGWIWGQSCVLHWYYRCVLVDSVKDYSWVDLRACCEVHLYLTWSKIQECGPELGGFEGVPSRSSLHHHKLITVTHLPTLNCTNLWSTLPHYTTPHYTTLHQQLITHPPSLTYVIVWSTTQHSASSACEQASHWTASSSSSFQYSM